MLTEPFPQKFYSNDVKSRKHHKNKFFGVFEIYTMMCNIYEHVSLSAPWFRMEPVFAAFYLLCQTKKRSTCSQLVIVLKTTKLV